MCSKWHCVEQVGEFCTLNELNKTDNLKFFKLKNLKCTLCWWLLECLEESPGSVTYGCLWILKDLNIFMTGYPKKMLGPHIKLK